MSKFKILALESDEEEPALDLEPTEPEEPEEPAEDPDTPVEPIVPDIEPIDIAELNVTKLGEAELASTDAALKEEEYERQENLGTAITDLELLQTAAESFSECLYGNGTKREFALATEVYKRLRTDLGFKGNKHQISLEQFDVTDGKQLALESIKDTIIQVCNAIIKVIRDAINWLKKAFKGFFSSAKRMAQAHVQMTSLFLKHRSVFDCKFAELTNTRAIDLVRYVDLPTHKVNLTYQDKQPPDMTVPSFNEHGHSAGTTNPSYAQAFDSITELLKIHLLFRKNISADMLKSFELVNKSLTEKQFSEPINFFRPSQFKLANAQAAVHVEGIDCPDGSVMFANTGYLGNVIYVTQFNTARTLNPVNTGLESWTKWKLKLTTSNADMRDGWMAHISTKDVQEAFKSMATLSHELIDAEKTVDQAEHILGSLEALMTSFRSSFQEDSLLSQDENLERSKVFTRMTAAAGSIVMNTNTFLTQSTQYAFKIQASWLYYLNAIVTHEKGLMK